MSVIKSLTIAITMVLASMSTIVGAAAADTSQTEGTTAAAPDFQLCSPLTETPRTNGSGYLIASGGYYCQGNYSSSGPKYLSVCLQVWNGSAYANWSCTNSGYINPSQYWMTASCFTGSAFTTQRQFRTMSTVSYYSNTTHGDYLYKTAYSDPLYIFRTCN